MRRAFGSVIGALVLAMTLGAPLAAQGKRDPARMEANLIKEVRHELLLLPYYTVFDWLEFKVADDVVTLTGQVTRPTLKSDAEAVVKKIEAVARVVNQIEVLPVSPNDDRIRRATFVALYNESSPLFRYGLGSTQSIHIVVNRGHVILKGQVDSQQDKNVAGIRANGVPGAFSVKNELTVRK